MISTAMASTAKHVTASPDKASPAKKNFAAAPRFEGSAPDRVPQPKGDESARSSRGPQRLPGGEDATAARTAE